MPLSLKISMTFMSMRMQMQETCIRMRMEKDIMRDVGEEEYRVTFLDGYQYKLIDKYMIRIQGQAHQYQLYSSIPPLSLPLPQPQPQPLLQHLHLHLLQLCLYSSTCILVFMIQVKRRILNSLRYSTVLLFFSSCSLSKELLMSTPSLFTPTERPVLILIQTETHPILVYTLLLLINHLTLPTSLSAYHK